MIMNGPGALRLHLLALSLASHCAGLIVTFLNVTFV